MFFLAASSISPLDPFFFFRLLNFTLRWVGSLDLSASPPDNWSQRFDEVLVKLCCSVPQFFDDVGSVQSRLTIFPAVLEFHSSPLPWHWATRWAPALTVDGRSFLFDPPREGLTIAVALFSRSVFECCRSFRTTARSRQDLVWPVEVVWHPFSPLARGRAPQPSGAVVHPFHCPPFCFLLWIMHRGRAVFLAGTCVFCAHDLLPSLVTFAFLPGAFFFFRACDRLLTGLRSPVVMSPVVDHPSTPASEPHFSSCLHSPG